MKNAVYLKSERRVFLFLTCGKHPYQTTAESICTIARKDWNLMRSPIQGTVPDEILMEPVTPVGQRMLQTAQKLMPNIPLCSVDKGIRYSEGILPLP